MSPNPAVCPTCGGPRPRVRHTRKYAKWEFICVCGHPIGVSTDQPQIICDKCGRENVVDWPTKGAK